jgi:hypothetical protein
MKFCPNMFSVVRQTSDGQVQWTESHTCGPMNFAALCHQIKRQSYGSSNRSLSPDSGTKRQLVYFSGLTSAHCLCVLHMVNNHNKAMPWKKNWKLASSEIFRRFSFEGFSALENRSVSTGFLSPLLSLVRSDWWFSIVSSVEIDHNSRPNR